MGDLESGLADCWGLMDGREVGDMREAVVME